MTHEWTCNILKLPMNIQVSRKLTSDWIPHPWSMPDIKVPESRNLHPRNKKSGTSLNNRQTAAQQQLQQQHGRRRQSTSGTKIAQTRPHADGLKTSLNPKPCCLTSPTSWKAEPSESSALRGIGVCLLELPEQPMPPQNPKPFNPV